MNNSSIGLTKHMLNSKIGQLWGTLGSKLGQKAKNIAYPSKVMFRIDLLQEVVCRLIRSK